MTAAFDYAFNQTVALEGGYTNDPLDHGGETNFGVTAATWAAYCAEVHPLDRRSVRDITLNDAAAVYAHGYWTPLGLDAITDRRVAAEIFDTAVNCGLHAAAEIAQRAVNLIRADATPALLVDGRLGPVSRQAINRCDATALLAALNFYQAAYYAAIVEKNPSQRKFIRGWMKRCLVTR